MTIRARKAMVEAAYQLEQPEADCIGALAHLAAGAFDNRGPTAAFATDTDGTEGVKVRALFSAEEVLDRALRFSFHWLPIHMQRADATRPPVVANSSEVFGADVMGELARATGIVDFAGMVCPYGRGVVAIGAARSEPRRFSVGERAQWMSVAAHVGAAWCLRNALMSEPQSGIAFSPDGALVEDNHLPEDAPSSLREVLRRAVYRRERLRASKEEELWPAIIAGEWIIVDRFERSGVRHVVAYPCAALSRPFQALTPAESVVLRGALNGTTSKELALDLKVSEATVCRLIQRAIRSIGLCSLAEASHVRAMAQDTIRIGYGVDSLDVGVLRSVDGASAGPPVPAHSAGLTLAEREVLAAIIRGHSHQQIAALRGTSKRTIANQVASLFRKLKVNSRRELIARELGGGEHRADAQRLCKK